MNKSKNIAVSELARFAVAPADYGTGAAPNNAALKYGTKAHSKLGKGPSVVLLFVMIVAVTAVAKYLGAF